MATRPEPVQVGQLWLHPGTNDAVASTLNNLLATESRVRLWYGDQDTGRAWMEEYDVLGRIGRSTGQHKVPLLIYSSRSTGGPAILDSCIVRIDRTDGVTLYKHPQFHTGLAYSLPQFRPYDSHPWFVCDLWDKEQAGFKTEAGAQRWLNFMNGTSYRK